jgi:hypothetical protein
MTGSLASAYSSQEANAAITQQYAGTCSVDCSNSISGVQIDVIDSIVGGGINLTQACSVDANCLYQTNQSSLADVLFKAANSASAAGGLLPGLAGSETASYQNINENILQSVTQQCGLTSSNDITNVDVYAQSSTIGGGINITQSGSATGSCTFDTIMNATELATATADNCSAAGKMAKKSCGGKGGGIGSILLYGGIAIAAFVGIMLLYKAFKKKVPDAAAAAAAAGTTDKGTPRAKGTSGSQPSPTSTAIAGAVKALAEA